MNETKKIGIGYTIFEFEGKVKRPLTMVKASQGNFMNELKKLEERMRRENSRQLMLLCMGAFTYGYAVRTILAL
jgi:hypothetical protein